MSLCWLLGHVWASYGRAWLRLRVRCVEQICVCCGKKRKSDWSIG